MEIEKGASLITLAVIDWSNGSILWHHPSVTLSFLSILFFISTLNSLLIQAFRVKREICEASFFPLTSLPSHQPRSSISSNFRWIKPPEAAQSQSSHLVIWYDVPGACMSSTQSGCRSVCVSPTVSLPPLHPPSSSSCAIDHLLLPPFSPLSGCTSSSPPLL